jgi:hypothetical protein
MVHDSSYHFESRTAKCIANPDRPAMTMDSGLDPTPLQPKLYHVYSRRHWFEQLISLVTIDLKEQFTFIGSLYKKFIKPFDIDQTIINPAAGTNVNQYIKDDFLRDSLPNACHPSNRIPQTVPNQHDPRPIASRPPRSPRQNRRSIQLPHRQHGAEWRLRDQTAGHSLARRIRNRGSRGRLCEQLQERRQSHVRLATASMRQLS